MERIWRDVHRPFGGGMTRKQANSLLDFVRAGGHAAESEILFALWITGDLMGGK